ncbi:MAG: hypothetical protein HUK12_09835 [Muribaculaceae bacterium]|nr:hypothetical protein [Muribaculaceae bacterium]
MANKRTIKKEILRACGEVAGECVFAESAFNIDLNKMDEVIVRVALLQESSLKKVSVSFDKTPKSFASLREYRKERRNYFRTCFKALHNEMTEQFTEIVKEMNALVLKK